MLYYTRVYQSFVKYLSAGIISVKSARNRREHGGNMAGTRREHGEKSAGIRLVHGGKSYCIGRILYL